MIMTLGLKPQRMFIITIMSSTSDVLETALEFKPEKDKTRYIERCRELLWFENLPKA